MPPGRPREGAEHRAVGERQGLAVLRESRSGRFEPQTEIAVGDRHGAQHRGAVGRRSRLDELGRVVEAGDGTRMQRAEPAGAVQQEGTAHAEMEDDRRQSHEHDELRGDASRQDPAQHHGRTSTAGEKM